MLFRFVFQEVAGHPVVFAGAREILDGLAEVAPVQFRAALAGGTDEHHLEALIKCHRDERGLAIARHALDADPRGIDRGIVFEVVESARGAPAPGAERAPIIGLARLAFVREADDALPEARAVVGLDARGRDLNVAPARGDELLGRRRIGEDRRGFLRGAAATAASELRLNPSRIRSP